MSPPTYDGRAMELIEGDFEVSDARFAIVAARWNEDIVERLVQGAQGVLLDCGVPAEAISLVQVPGAFEIPLALDSLADSEGFDGLIALGAVIRGETAHFDYVAGECARGIAQVTLEYGIPIGFGVLACENMAQAVARAGEGDDNKGVEAASATVEMVSLLRRFDDFIR